MEPWPGIGLEGGFISLLTNLKSSIMRLTSESSFINKIRRNMQDEEE